MAVEADVTGLVALRDQTRDAFRERDGINLTYLPFLVESIVASLQDHPGLNASYRDEGVTVHAGYHIGIAVSTDAGLMVPVIRDADRRSVTELAREIARLAEACRNRTVSLEDLRGATFTIDNTGAFGSLISQPIIVPGEVAIVTTEAIRRELRVMDDGSFAARSVINLAISFDHRALDGAEVGGFMADVRARIQAIEPGQTLS
jgi:2-oxoisovalerate dehydrogenase E2 component (dihydrolipoyl transacylase)